MYRRGSRLSTESLIQYGLLGFGLLVLYRWITRPTIRGIFSDWLSGVTSVVNKDVVNTTHTNGDGSSKSKDRPTPIRDWIDDNIVWWN